MAIQQRAIGSLTEIYVGGGNFITQSAPTNFHKFWTRKVLTSGETASMFKEVTTSEKSAIEATDAKWAQPSEELIAQATACGAVYNSSTGFFELNGLTDLTAKDMRNILEWGRFADFCNICDAPSYLNARRLSLRTTLPSVCMNTVEIPPISWISFDLERIAFTIKVGSVSMPRFKLSRHWPLYPCGKLTAIDDYIVLSSDNIRIGAYHNGITTPLLKTLKLYNLTYNANLRYLPALSLESLQFLVDNATNTSPITVTLHADAYARLTDTLIAQAASKQITFVTT